MCRSSVLDVTRDLFLPSTRSITVGGILGQKLELVTEDDQSKPGQSATAVRKLITQDKVVAILGDATSSATLEAAPIAQDDKIPMITPTATNPRITEVGDFIFRVCFLDEFQGRVLARFAREKLNAEKIFTLTDVKQDYSVDLPKFFKDEFSKLGGTIVGEQSYSTGDTDFRAQLTSIRGSSTRCGLRARLLPGSGSDRETGPANRTDDAFYRM